MSGRYFDEWQVGDRIEHPIRRTVTETDNLLFSTMTHNPQPLHIDAEAARASEFGQILVNGTFTFSLMIGLSVGETTLGTLVANLGYDKLVMPKPVFIGDTMRATSDIVELRDSKSRPDAGLVTFRHELLNQRNEIVCQCLRTALLKRRPA
ncbi:MULTISPECIES: MaoC family dehydratase [Sphingobium]|jgi:acyl dehydratase|uniref:MaoC family dehydratase n=1 Tax=Sphingobium TaxID=165695 RepID=UPI000C3A5ACF|nr:MULTISPECIES: MaoC family dehydratase [Sphingobium]MEE2741419.1 MaoC family dehydratase [Pseudomonadota bacterium]MAX14968.1 dehydratase [Sphingobium sp.]MBA37718.1 dehydratase [Sphingobium sp.]MBS50701.1 dehydratase [Sphingobium sp.]MCC4257201.1 MaoC family dehydratase [Sphingobium lactosutens]|tara:strand:+ start:5955 stop:6407 length:453 start_codon:yes stop_codon:yes gene_type:complete